MTQPTAPHPSGYWTLLTSGLTVVIAFVGVLLIQPRLSERRLNIDDQYILTATEVRSLPAGTLAVVLDRSPGEDHNDFKYRLLELVLKRSGRPFALGLSEVVVAQDEAVAALEQDVASSSRNPFALSVGVYGAGVDVNRRLLPVPIPVTGGILGLRSGWTHRSQMARLATIRTRKDLGDIVLLQGLGWSDVDIFDAAGLRTFTARSEDLFRLVDHQRVQLFPRGIAELEREAQLMASSTSDTSLDPHLLLAYPFAGFFYVSPDNQPLADAIQTGFERAIADGSYQRLVEELIFTPWLRRTLLLKNRRVIALANPVAADVLSAVESRHWIVPWPELLNEEIETGEQLCAAQKLKALCS
ncbi:MAG: hypothetical protein ACPGXW_04220 [Synechococcus sp.]